MPILTKGVYGFETNSKKTPFGLLNEQRRANGIINAAGWFNAAGERLGSGDLSLKDMDNISKHISVNDLFFVLTEADSDWNIPSGVDRTEPWLEYIVKNAAWIIGRTNAAGPLIIRSRADISTPITKIKKDGVSYLRASRQDVKKSLTVLTAKKDIKKELPEDSSDDDMVKTNPFKAVKKKTSPTSTVKSKFGQGALAPKASSVKPTPFAAKIGP